MNIKVKKKRGRRAVVVERAAKVSELVEQLTENFEYLNERFVGREESLACLQLALLCKGHVLLEGRAGVAKSQLAKAVFAMFETPDTSEGGGTITFSKQLSPGTHPEELFGPMNVSKFREESVFEANIEGMLPTAHFAFLDETYRGSSALLSSVMGVLNEREFYNGAHKIICPLITAIGTSNFRSNDEEMEAFQDRWMFTVPVLAAESATQRLKVLDAHIENFKEQGSLIEGIPHIFTLQDLQTMQAAVDEQEIDPDILEQFSDLISNYHSNDPSAYVSDRKFCAAYKAIQAYKLLHKDGAEFEDGISEYEVADHLAFMFCLTDDNFTAYRQLAAELITNMANMSRESAELDQVEDTVENLLASHGRWKKLKEPQRKKLSADFTTAVGIMRVKANDSSASANFTKCLNSFVDKLDDLGREMRADLISVTAEADPDEEDDESLPLYDETDDDDDES